MGKYNNVIEDIKKHVPNEEESAVKKTRFRIFWEIWRTRLWEILLLNVIYVICCIPILTFGPATAGLVRVMLGYTQERQTPLFGEFFRIWTKPHRKDLARSFIIGIGTIVYLTGCAAGLWWYGAAANQISKAWYIFMGIAVCAAITIMLMTLYVYILLIAVDLSFKDLLKNSFLMGVAFLKVNFPVLLLSLVLLAGMVFLILCFPQITFSLLFFPAAFNWFVISYCIFPIVEKHVIRPYYSIDNV